MQLTPLVRPALLAALSTVAFVLASSCAGKTRTASGGICSGAAMVGTWHRATDGLVMELVADGCVIRGTSDNPSYRHTIEGTYNDDARTTIGTIRRTTVSNGCVTVMKTTWVLTDRKHFTMAIVGTDGICDLPPTYSEVSTFVRECNCDSR